MSSKLNRKINKITNRHYIYKENILYDQPIRQLFPKRWPLSNLGRTKTACTHKVKRHRIQPQNQATENLRYDTNKAVQSLRVAPCMMQIVMRLSSYRMGKKLASKEKIYVYAITNHQNTCIFFLSVSLDIHHGSMRHE